MKYLEILKEDGFECGFNQLLYDMVGEEDPEQRHELTKEWWDDFDNYVRDINTATSELVNLYKTGNIKEVPGYWDEIQLIEDKFLVFKRSHTHITPETNEL